MEHRQPILKPTGAGQSTGGVKLNYFITNREIIIQNGVESIRADGYEHPGDNLRFGSYDLDTRNFHLFKEPLEKIELDYEKISQTDPANLTGSSRFFKELYHILSSPQDGGDVLFFIHGFNTDLEGVKDTFQILNDQYVNQPGSPIKHVVQFTWPGKSPDIPLHYHDDKKDAIRSGESLARVIKKYIEFLRDFIHKSRNNVCGKKIHLMVHSMGHRVLKHLMADLQEVPELFGEIILLAADIEYDIFDRGNPFYDLIQLGSRIHIYYHEDDRVLGISTYTKNFSNRLGQYGRKHMESGLRDVFDADVSDTSDDPDAGIRSDLLNHWYYYSSKQVVEDIRNVLNGTAVSRFLVKPQSH